MENTIASAGDLARDDTTKRGRRPLLAIDGDSFAHRAYHALPKSMRSAKGQPAGALVGFVNMLVRLWQEEAPRAVVVAWDTLGTPTYRNELLSTYQGGRQFDADLVEQLDVLPGLVAAGGIVCGKQAGFEADDFLAAAAAQERLRGGTSVVATSDRDAFQLADETTTIVQPVRGTSTMARIGPDEVRSRYGVDPTQVVDFIALRGDPSDRIPGARGVGEKTAAALLAEHGSLAELLAGGRFASEAEALRRFQRIARLDPQAPLPELVDHVPNWSQISARASELGLEQLAGRLAGL